MSKTLNDLDWYASLLSTICPACGGPKASKSPPCSQHILGLPDSIRRGLCRGLADGYSQAMRGAMAHLGVETPHLPPEVS